MTQPETRQQHLLKLEPLCRLAAEELTEAGWAPEKVQEAFKQGVCAECVSCGIEVSGTELYALSQPPSAEYANAKIGRLRMGDCARKGCDSYYYRMTFQSVAGVDWKRLVAQFEKGEPHQDHAEGDGTEKNRLTKYLRTVRVPVHVWITLAALVVVLAMRQWYVGGRIPLLREPEHFKVDVGTEESGQ